MGERFYISGCNTKTKIIMRPDEIYREDIIEDPPEGRGVIVYLFIMAACMIGLAITLALI